MDFVRPTRRIPLSLVAGRGHYDAVIEEIRYAETSVWIATSNLKELLVEDGRRISRRRGQRRNDRYGSVLAVFAELAKKNVELRILHARYPSRAFRDEFDRHPVLVDGGLELRLCPRVHMKAVIVDGRVLYLGSANWTGAGLGAKGAHRRNFEIGVVTEDEAMIDDVQAMYDRIWRGLECVRCRLRRECESPLDLEERLAGQQTCGPPHTAGQRPRAESQAKRAAGEARGSPRLSRRAPATSSRPSRAPRLHVLPPD